MYIIDILIPNNFFSFDDEEFKQIPKEILGGNCTQHCHFGRYIIGLWSKIVINGNAPAKQ